MSDKSYSTVLAGPPPLFVGIDLGTSGCRAVAIDDTGIIKAESSITYPPHPAQTPLDWWQATQTVLATISAEITNYHIKSISVAGTSGTVLFCNDSGKPLSPALMYHDQRAEKQALLLKQYAPNDSVVLNASSGLAKVLWLFEHHRPDEAFHIVHQADWIAGLLCRRFNFSDFNNALKTGFDPVNKIWPLWLTDLLSGLNINRTCLPEVYAPGTPVANINPHVAAELNLPLDCNIVTGTTDSTAALIATGAKKIGDAVTSLGSTLVLKIISDKPINDTSHGIYSQPYGEHWLVGGASNSGGAVLRYYFNDEQMQVLSQNINPDQPTHLNYYPLLKTGERFPINDPELEPQLSPKTKDDVIFFQGLLEGIAEIERRGYKLLEKLGAPYPQSIITTGGGAVNLVWQKIREKKLGTPITIPEHMSAAYGSALIAAKMI